MKSLISFFIFLILYFYSVEHQAISQNISSDEWIQITDSNHPRVEAISATVNNKIYIFSGFTAYEKPHNYSEEQLLVTTSTEVFEPSLVGSDSSPWKELAPIPIAVTHTAAIVVENDIWIPGGFAGNSPGVSIDNMQIYNTITNTWSEGPLLPEPMASHGVVRVGSQIHVFGGLKPDRQTDNDAHYFYNLDNPELGWQIAAPFPNARNHFGTTTLKGKIYAIGGQFGHDDGWEDLPFVSRYDPMSDTWENLAELPSKRSHFEPGTITYSGKIIVVGGRNQNDANILEDIIKYNPAENEWNNLDTLPTQMLAPVAKIINNKFFVSHGGHTWKEPYQSAYVKNYFKEESDVLGFWPEQIHAEFDQNSSGSVSTFLWTLSHKTKYSINTTSIPDWVKLEDNHSTNFTDPSSKTIHIHFETEGLNPGTYNFKLIASAVGYADAELNIIVIINQTDEPEKPNNPIDHITDIENPGKSLPAMKVYPNPNNGNNIFLELSGLNAQFPVDFKIYDVFGKLVFEHVKNSDSEGNLYYEIQNISLNPGIYSLIAYDEKTNLKSKILIQ